MRSYINDKHYEVRNETSSRILNVLLTNCSLRDTILIMISKYDAFHVLGVDTKYGDLKVIPRGVDATIIWQWNDTSTLLKHDGLVEIAATHNGETLHNCALTNC